MKVTPIAQGSGEPGLTIGSIEVGRSVSREKVENAKRAFSGDSPITMTEETPIDPQVARLKKRRIVVNTNKTPERYTPPMDHAQQAVPHGTEAIAQPATIDNVETAQEADVTKPLSPQFAALARQRRALQQREQALSVREREMAEKSQTGQVSNGLDLSQIKADPLGVLTKAGVSYDDLTQAILQGPKQASFDAEALKQELLSSIKQELSKDFEERDTHAEQEVLTQIRREAEALVNQGDEFELVKVTKSLPEAIELIHRTWKKTGEVLETEEALRLVEEELTEQLAPIAQSKKIQSRLAPREAAQPQQMRTLTNRDAAPVPTTAKQRAIAAFYGNLKK